MSVHFCACETCCVFCPGQERMLVHAFAWSKTIKNTRKWVKKYLSSAREAHVRLTKKNEEKQKKSLLVSYWEWLPKAGWHPKAGYSFGILLFFDCFSTWPSHVYEQKCFMIFECFPSFSTIGHAFAGRNTQHTWIRKRFDVTDLQIFEEFLQQ